MPPSDFGAFLAMSAAGAAVLSPNRSPSPPGPANILVAIVLLAVSGLCWWQTESWVEAVTASAAGGTGPEARWALDHLRRVYTIASATEVELVLTGVGALAGFVGAVLFYSGFPSGSGTWARDILPGANLVAVLAATTAGLLVTRQAGAAAAGPDPPLRPG